MTNAPERIWMDSVEYMHAFTSAEDCEGCYGGQGIEYVRADIYEILRAERDALLAAYKPTEAALIGVTPWQPPPEAERPHEYRCLGLVFGSWCDVVWYDGEWCFGQTLDPCDITAFAPLPPAPKAAP